MNPETHKTIESLSASEAVALYGPESLSDEQILSTLLSIESPSPRELLSGHSLQRLISMGPVELLALGISSVDSARLMVLHEIERRSSRLVHAHLTSPRLAAAYLVPKAVGLLAERFGILCLDAKGRVIADHLLSQGTSTATLISPREFFRDALLFGATTAIAWHNHPSGDPTPSREDLALTVRLRSIGECLGVPLADHLIIGHETWHSFRSSEGWDRDITVSFDFSASQEDDQ